MCTEKFKKIMYMTVLIFMVSCGDDSKESSANKKQPISKSQSRDLAKLNCFSGKEKELEKSLNSKNYFEYIVAIARQSKVCQVSEQETYHLASVMQKDWGKHRD